MSNPPRDPIYRCPHCGGQAVKVFDSRHVDCAEPIVRRRRKCTACSHRWTTYEITDVAYAAICEQVELLKTFFPAMPRRAMSETVDTAPFMSPAHRGGEA